MSRTVLIGPAAELGVRITAKSKTLSDAGRGTDTATPAVMNLLPDTGTAATTDLISSLLPSVATALTASGLTPGNYTAKVAARDTAGNVSAYSTAVPFIIGGWAGGDAGRATDTLNVFGDASKTLPDRGRGADGMIGFGDQFLTLKDAGRMRLDTGAHTVPSSGKGPTSPPVTFSLDASSLAGPSSAPPGAVIVSPSGTPLDTLADANPAGTTFYLLAGSHHLSSPPWGAQFGQVHPKDNMTFIGAPGAILDGEHLKKAAFANPAAGVTISHLEIINFAQDLEQFTINTDTGDNWLISYCNIHNNTGAAIGIGSGCTVDHCWVHHNSQYGFSSYNAISGGALTCSVLNVALTNCELAFNGNRADEWTPAGTRTGNGRNGGGKFWDTDGITVTGNWVHDNYGSGIWCDTNNIDLVCTGNYITDNDFAGVMYEISYNFQIDNNYLARNAIYLGSGAGDNFPYAGLYISESGGDPLVKANRSASTINNNTFEDNWDQICLYESPDRFCNDWQGPAPGSYGNASDKVWKPKGHGITLGMCRPNVTKTLTVTLTAGSPNFTVTAGVLDGYDDGAAISGAGIPAGTKIAEPDTVGQFAFVAGAIGVHTTTSGTMSAAATASGSTQMLFAAGSIATAPGFDAARWETKNVTVSGNVIKGTIANILASPNNWKGQGTSSLLKVALCSQAGSSPAWATWYHGAVIQNALASRSTRNNIFANNDYQGTVRFQRGSAFTDITFATWTSGGTDIAQDIGSTLS